MSRNYWTAYGRVIFWTKYAEKYGWTGELAEHIGHWVNISSERFD